MTRRRWIADKWDATTATLTGNQAAHLARVLRARPGAEYDVVAGDTVWQAVIITADESSVVFRLVEKLDATESLSITVVLSIFKFDRLEWAIEKLTELGVTRIEPAVAQRTEKHLAQAAAKRVERWRRIALEAAKQSRRSSIPEIAGPRSLKQALGAATSPDDRLRLVLAENEKQYSLIAALQHHGNSSSAVLAIGPEGGWTPEEEALFSEHGWIAVSVGSTILRAETAAIAAVSIATAHMRE